MTREITLTQGKIALVDDEDYEHLSQFRWRAWNGNKRCWYAARKEGNHTIFMHRAILGLQIGDAAFGDHVNHDGLNNTRRNLRVASRQQNNANRKNYPHTSQYKGVRFIKPTGKWRSEISLNNSSVHIGSFETELDAAKAYDRKAVELYGDFALINFPKYE